MKILRIVLQIVVFILVFSYPSKMDSHLHIFLSKKVSIKINKNHPSYVAYDAVNIKKTALLPTPKEPIRIVNLSTDSQDEVVNHFHPLAKKMVLNTIVIKKDIEVFNPQAVNENYIRNSNLTDEVYGDLAAPSVDQKNWVAEFKPYFRKQTQASSEKSNWNRPQYKQGALATANNRTQATGLKTFVADDQVKHIKEVVNQDSGARQNRIIGIVEIGNLPFTNEHHIEIRRFEEGVFRENGTANLSEATYEIFPSDLKGFILGRLVDKRGKILGEGVVRITETVLSKTGAHRGPKILIKAKADVHGRIVSAYDSDSTNPKNQAAAGAIFQGQLEKPVGKDGQIKFDNIVRNSPTNLIAESKGHFASQQIIIAGENFSTEMIPEKMGNALKQIVSDLKQQNLNDPNLSIIMGKVTFDGKPISGVNITIENQTEVETIYFNSLMLPDIKLKATSENGYYAFIVEGSEMMTLMAYRGGRYFGHINTVISPGITSFTEIQNTTKTENVEIKVYEPFSGLPEISELNLQGQSEEIVAANGLAAVQLPYLGRWSFLFSNPSEKYIPAHYTYIEKSDYIYVPLISREWMTYAFSSTKRSIYPATNIVVGFVIDEDFEVEVPGLDQIRNHIIYFDYAGKIVERGTQGGGFILYNLPEGLYEPLVFGAKSQKVYSRIAPLKSNDLFVFTYKLDGAI